MKSVLFFLESWGDLKRWENHESISPNKEDYGRCVARQFWEEVTTCRRMGVPIFFAIKRENLEGGTNRHTSTVFFPGCDKPVQVFNDKGETCDISGHTVLIRCDARYEDSCIKEVIRRGGIPLVSIEGNDRVQRWYKLVGNNFFERRVGWINTDMVGQSLLNTMEALKKHSIAGDVFIKLEHKSSLIQAGVYPCHEALEMLASASLTLSGSDVLISQPMVIREDAKGKLEYRFFVVNGRPVCPSRYIDYDTDYEIPGAVVAFAESFARAYVSIFPAGYTLDVALCTDGTPAVVELNGINASGRYERNDFSQILNAL